MPPIEELVLFTLALLVAGGVSGVLAGMFGIGGGAILVPVFFQVFGLFGVDEAVRMHLSVGTSIAVIVPTSLRSYFGHRKHNMVDEKLLKLWVVAVPLGTFLAAAIAAFSSSEALRAIFACIAILVGLRMLLNRAHWKLGADLPGKAWTWFAGVVIGVLSGLMGIGGGILCNTFMTVFGRPVHQAVATSAGVGVLISIPGLFGYIVAGWGAEGLPIASTGYINWIAAAIVMPVSLLAAPAGVTIAHKMTKRQLEVGFGIFLMVVAARFFISLAE